jgi:hypothetical protein
MYPSGVWRGFWQQAGYGRQPMDEFVLTFGGGRVVGSGRDLIGQFTFGGIYDPATGEVRMQKKYVGKHVVQYAGGPEGEGGIGGTWSIGPYWSGPFLLHPAADGRWAKDEEFAEIGR